MTDRSCKILHLNRLRRRLFNSARQELKIDCWSKQDGMVKASRLGSSMAFRRPQPALKRRPSKLFLLQQRNNWKRFSCFFIRQGTVAIYRLFPSLHSSRCWHQGICWSRDVVKLPQAGSEPSPLTFTASNLVLLQWSHFSVSLRSF